VTAQRIAASGPDFTERQKSLAFFTVLIAVVLEVADSTIVNTALPAIRQALGASSAAMQWIIAGYLLGLGTLLLLGGRLGDAFGYRRVFLIGVSAFVLASTICGIAQSPSQLVLARIGQGVAAAIMAPQSLAIIQHLYSPLERVSKLAWFGLILGSAAIIGPIVGGSLIALDLFGLGWRLVFLVNLPIGVIALAMAWRTLPLSRSAADPHLDLSGAGMFAAGFGAILLAMIQGAELGWPNWSLLVLVLGCVAVWIGWRRALERRRLGQQAIIAPELFRLPTFRWGIAAALAHSSAFVGFLMIFSVSLQQGLRFTPLETALIHIPFGLGVMGGVGLLVPRLLPRFGRRLPIWGGLGALTATVSVLCVIRWDVGSGAVLILPLALAGVGFGALSGPLGPIVVAEVDREHAGAASATLRTAQQLGGALGIATVGGAYFALAGTDSQAFLDGLVPGGATIVILLLAAIGFLARQPRDIFGRPR
jgi:EmrB/QacA subfamily drug resistance transporter